MCCIMLTKGYEVDKPNHEVDKPDYENYISVSNAAKIYEKFRASSGTPPSIMGKFKDTSYGGEGEPSC